MAHLFRPLQDCCSNYDPSWNNECYFSTIQAAVAQGQVYVNGRGTYNFFPVKYTPGVGWNGLPLFACFTDADGWNNRKHFATLRMLSFGDKLYILGRGTSLLQLACFDPGKNEWSKLRDVQWLADSEGFDQPQCYETIRFVALDNKLYVFARSPSGLCLAYYDPQTNVWTKLPKFPWLTDTQGFNRPQHYDTIRISAINHKLYICVRTPTGLQVAYYTPETRSLTFTGPLRVFTDDDGWNDLKFYRTIRMEVIGDKWYFCAKRQAEVHLACFDTETKEWSLLESKSGLLTDAEFFYDSIRTCVINSKLIIFGRAIGTSFFLIYNTLTHLWEDGPWNEWLSEEKFNQKLYYTTLQAVGTGDKMYVIMRAEVGLKIASFESPQDADNSST